MTKPTLSTQVDDTSPRETMRQEIKDYFKAAGMAEPWAWEDCVNDYTEAILALFDTYVQEVIGEDECIGTLDRIFANREGAVRDDLKEQQRLTAKELLK